MSNAKKARLNLALLGGPGSGKGTQAESLQREFGLTHISSGQLFREHLKRSTPLGELAHSYMNRGELVPDKITNEIIETRLRETGPDGFLLDGFPRTTLQASALSEILQRLDTSLAGVLNIQVSDGELVERLSGRWTCSQCQAPYHLLFRPPLKTGFCDKCGAFLHQREDDKPETVRARLATYHQQTEPLIEFYNRRGLLRLIDGEGDVMSVFNRMHKAVEQIYAQSTA